MQVWMGKSPHLCEDILDEISTTYTCKFKNSYNVKQGCKVKML